MKFSSYLFMSFLSLTASVSVLADIPVEPMSFDAASFEHEKAISAFNDFKSQYQAQHKSETQAYRSRIAELEEFCKKNCRDFDCSKKIQDEMIRLKQIIDMKLCREGLPSQSLCQWMAKVDQRAYELKLTGGALTYNLFLHEVIQSIRENHRVSNFFVHPLKDCTQPFQEGGRYDEDLNPRCIEMTVDFKYKQNFRRLSIRSAPYGLVGFPSSAHSFMKKFLKELRALTTRLEPSEMGLRNFSRFLDSDREKRGPSPDIINEGYQGIIYSMTGSEVDCDRCNR